jgi:sRNA-binding carbon storage regulator CsrA
LSILSVRIGLNAPKEYMVPTEDATPAETVSEEVND